MTFATAISQVLFPFVRDWILLVSVGKVTFLFLTIQGLWGKNLPWAFGGCMVMRANVRGGRFARVSMANYSCVDGELLVCNW